jgi:hypothetical protein
VTAMATGGFEPVEERFENAIRPALDIAER